jgi:RNA polymerase sigma-70 factor (ECF subfamily)
VSELLAELLERCRSGDPDAITILVHRFQPWALDLATALLNDPHLAEDAVQAGFIRALSRLADLREPAAFPGWLRQIIRTECHRIARRRTESSLGERIDAVEEQTPADQAETHERCRLVRQALAQLPPASRQAAELFYLDELDTAEVAERLAVPPGTVKRRLHDARLRLRQMLLGYVEPTPPRAKKPPGGQIPL